MLVFMSLLASTATSFKAKCAVHSPSICMGEKKSHGFQPGCPVAGGKCNRCLPHFVGASFNQHVTREGCACLCSKAGYALAGVENGNNCYCGNSLTESGFCATTSQNNCAPGRAVACDGDKSEVCGGPMLIDAFNFTCPSDCKAYDPPSPHNHTRLFPRVHFTPPCYTKGGPHDIAATLYHQPTKTWHIMAGCWCCGGWQHITTKDMVHYTVHGTPQGFGGTGGMTIDDDGTIVAYAMSGGAIHFWTATDDTATAWEKSDTKIPGCCNDPIVWKSNGSWYALTANHGGPGGSGNYGYEGFYSSPALLGAKAHWVQLHFP